MPRPHQPNVCVWVNLVQSDSDYGLIIRDRDGRNLITQDGFGIGVVGDVNITGEISATHVSADVLNVVTLWTGDESILVNQSFGQVQSESVTISLDGNLDDHGMVFIMTGQAIYAVEISDIPTTGEHILRGATNPAGRRSNYVGVRRNADGDELTIYAQSQGSLFNVSPIIRFTARRILGVKGPMPTVPTPVPTIPEQPEIEVIPTMDGFEASWLIPDDGGSIITGQQLEWKLATNNVFLERILTTTDTDATVDTLAGGAFYHVRLRITNAVGLVYSSTHKIFVADAEGVPGEPGLPGIGSLMIYDTHTDAVPATAGEWRIRKGVVIVRDWIDVIDATEIYIHLSDMNDVDRRRDLNAQSDDDLIVVRIGFEQWASYRITNISKASMHRGFTVTAFENRAPALTPVETIAVDATVNFLFTKAPPGESVPGAMGVGSQQTYDTNTDTTPAAEGEWTVMDGTDSVTEWEEVLDADSICLYNENKDGVNVDDVFNSQSDSGLVGINVDAEQWVNYKIDSMTTSGDCTTFMVTMNQHTEPDAPVDLPTSGDVDFQFATAPPGESALGIEEIYASSDDGAITEPDNAWGHREPAGDWKVDIDSTNYGAAATEDGYLHKSTRQPVGQPAVGAVVVDDWVPSYIIS